MAHKILLVVPTALFVAGCATCETRVVDLEKRLGVLENKVGLIQKTEKEATAETPSAPQATPEETAATSTESLAPDTPTKKDIQAALKNAGFYDGDVDGKFGPRTKKAVEDFQAANGLIADGKVGPNTWNKLKNYYVPTTEQ